MILLQIFLVPIIALLLLIAIFMIGYSATMLPDEQTQWDSPISRSRDQDPGQVNHNSIPAESNTKDPTTSVCL